MRQIAFATPLAATTLAALIAAPAVAQDSGIKRLVMITQATGDPARGGRDKWIEIQGWDWGRTAKVDGFAVKQGTARAGKKGGAVDYAWSVEKAEPAPPPPDDHEQEMTIVAGQATPPSGGNAKFGAVSGMHRDSSVAAPAEKRQHGWRPSPKALERGAVRVKVRFPWVDCRVGARFPAAVLESASGVHDLTDMTVASCAPDAVTLNYAKVRVRAWDPVKKQEIVGSSR